MRIEIRVELEEKLIKTAAELGMSPTDYLNILIETVDFEVKNERVIINIPTMRPNVPQIQHKLRSNFVNRWK